MVVAFKLFFCSDFVYWHKCRKRFDKYYNFYRNYIINLAISISYYCILYI